MSATDTLLADLRRQLPLNASSRDLIQEIHDGLDDAVDAYRRAGLTPTDADRRAVEDFGDVAAVARECAAETITRLTVRGAILVALSYPAMLGCWSVFYRLFGHAALSSSSQFLGNGFTVLGIVTCLASFATIWLARRRSRTARQPDPSGGIRRPIAIGFAVLTLVSVLLTYVLSAFTHGRPDAPAAEITGRVLAEVLSTLATAVMVVAALRTIRASRRLVRAPAEPHPHSNSIL